MLKIYKLYLSQLIHAVVGLSGCRFYPSCSHYAEGAIEKYGIFWGGTKTLFRIMRCNPLNPGGYDPLL